MALPEPLAASFALPAPDEGLGRVPLGETGLLVAPLFLGAGEFGWRVNLPDALDILDRYAELGGNVVHTADSFAAGRSEHFVGRWLQTRHARDETIVAVRVGGHPDHPGLGPINLVRAVESSLTRLDTDRIDVLYLDGHADRETPLETVLATASWLVESGKVRSIGAAGFSAPKLVEARVLAAAGYPRIEAVDVPYNLLDRDVFDGDMRLVAGAQQLAVTATHPLAHGFLAGHHRQRSRAPQSARGAQLQARIDRRGQRVLRAIDAIGVESGAPAAAVAIAWLLSQRLIVAPIANAHDALQVDEIALGASLTLSRSQLSELQRAAA